MSLGQATSHESQNTSPEARPRIGVVLFQLGGPDSMQSVQPFLYNLFCDPDILDLPFGALLRKPLAKYISRRRWQHAAHGYAAIGRRSPILTLTMRQACALEVALRPYVDPRITVAMRYWRPFTADAVRQLAGEELDQIVLLPLYPQYSMTTTGSSLNEWKRCYRSNGLPVRVIESYHNDPLLIDAFVERIEVSLQHFLRRKAVHKARGSERPFAPPDQLPAAPGSASDVHLIFSAHSAPLSFIERGDPYQKQVQETTHLVMERGTTLAARRGKGSAWPTAHTLCYQSKVGRQRWLRPSLLETIDRLAAQGVQRMLVVPISFVSDHVETLHEVNHEARRRALRLGVRQFELVPGLGTSPLFVRALAAQVLRAAGLTASAENMVTSIAASP